MKFFSMLKRGANLFKVGRAIHALRKASDEDKKNWANHYLIELLGKSRGLPTKIGQIMTMGGDDAELRNTLNDSIPAMSFDQVEEIINKAYGAPWDTIFHSLEKEGNAASLGQVHFGKLRDGRPVAVKVQYPEIGDSVESELDLMGWMPKVGPVAKWGFNLEGYRDAFWGSFSRELDYLLEAEQQKRYFDLSRTLPGLVVPEIHTDLCRPTVLVQGREDGLSLDKAASMVLSQRQAMGRTLLNHYVFMLFRHGYVHSDPNPNNFAFRKGPKDSFSLVLYDYGSVLEISETVRRGLLRIILALRDKEPVDPVACLAAIGFDPEKLEDLRPTLPALLSVLFEPFIVEAPYDIADWKLSERFDQIVGDLKWWFRSAAPPELIFLMRTIHGLTVMLERLDVKLPWQFLMDKQCSDLYSSARSLQLSEFLPKAGSAMKFSGMARYLQIFVVKPNGNKVRLTMPARVADCIEDVIDPPVMESIVRQNIDLPAIQDRVRKSGFIPQTLFDLKDPEREVRVWLE